MVFQKVSVFKYLVKISRVLQSQPFTKPSQRHDFVFCMAKNVSASQKKCHSYDLAKSWVYYLLYFQKRRHKNILPDKHNMCTYMPSSWTTFEQNNKQIHLKKKAIFALCFYLSHAGATQIFLYLKNIMQVKITDLRVIYIVYLSWRYCCESVELNVSKIKNEQINTSSITYKFVKFLFSFSSEVQTVLIIVIILHMFFKWLVKFIDNFTSLLIHFQVPI